MKPGFETIDWTAPIDVEAYIAACPEGAKVKGVIVQGMLKHLEKLGKKPTVAHAAYHTFRDYSLREHMRLTVDVAKQAFPQKHLRESLRQLGWATFPAVRDTLIGKVVFGAFDDPRKVFRAIAKAYEVVGSSAQGVVVDSGPRFVHTHTKNAYGFLDTFHVGTAEGVCRALSRTPTLFIKRHSMHEAELYVEWI